jgi:hypothetical protein
MNITQGMDVRVFSVFVLSGLAESRSPIKVVLSEVQKGLVVSERNLEHEQDAGH